MSWQEFLKYQYFPYSIYHNTNFLNISISLIIYATTDFSEIPVFLLFNIPQLCSSEYKYVSYAICLIALFEISIFLLFNMPEKRSSKYQYVFYWIYESIFLVDYNTEGFFGTVFFASYSIFHLQSFSTVFNWNSISEGHLIF